jgi:hypothetical protein
MNVLMKAGLGLLLVWMALMQSAFAQDKPNILVIWGDDIGQSNISAYTMGMMGYRTPNIDRVAKEGMIFTDYYGEQSCTAGRSSFIMGQSVFRTGLSKVGLPGADLGMQKLRPRVMSPVSLAKIILVTRTRCCRPITVSTSSSATSITSTPRKSPKTRIIPRVPNSGNASGRVASSSHRLTARSKIPAR